MKLSVIIPSYRRPSDLNRCLAALTLQTRPADEVIVIVRESDTETLDVVSAFRRDLNTVRVVCVAEPGVIAALNCGLENAIGDVVVLTDDDAEAQGDWLQRIQASFNDEEIGAVGGRDWLQLPDDPTRFRPPEVTQVGVLSWWGKQYGNHHCPLRGHTKKVMFLKGANIACRRRALGRYQLDTRLRGSGAQVGWEIDLCLQIRRSGYTAIFDDRILVKHYCGRRATGDERDELTGPVFRDACFNHHFLIAKYFGLWRSLAYLCNGRLLGSHAFPGLFASVKWSFKGDRSVWQRLWQTYLVALEGFRAGRKARTVMPQGGGKLNAVQTG
jgi:glycosyltransferase involved in cell wall biosynthesis